MVLSPAASGRLQAELLPFFFAGAAPGGEDARAGRQPRTPAATATIATIGNLRVTPSPLLPLTRVGARGCAGIVVAIRGSAGDRRVGCVVALKAADQEVDPDEGGHDERDRHEHGGPADDDAEAGVGAVRRGDVDRPGDPGD